MSWRDLCTTHLKCASSGGCARVSDVPNRTDVLEDVACFVSARVKFSERSKEQREQELQELSDLDPERVARSVEAVAAAALQGRVNTTYYVPAVDIPGIVDMKSFSVPRITKEKDK